MQKIELIVFDLDGTLVETRLDIASDTNFTRTHFGLHALEEGVISSYVGQGISHLLQKALPELKHDALLEAYTIFVENYSRNLTVKSRLYNGVLATLKKFSKKKCAVLSNKENSLTQRITEDLKIAHFFKIVMGKMEGFPAKPDPASLNYIITSLGTTAEETVMVGDSKFDILTGKAAGCHTCAVSYGFGSLQELKTEQPNTLISNLQEMALYYK